MALLSAPAFVLWGSPASWLEVVAAVLALVMVGCNMRELHWGWPLAMISSLMYVGVFAGNRIYGDAALQVFFAAMACWGWFQWLRGHRADGSALRVAALAPRLAARRRLGGPVEVAVLGARALHQHRRTRLRWLCHRPERGRPVPAGAFIENWGAWLVVNLVSIGLFVHKGLWLTVGLYTVFAVLSVPATRPGARMQPVPAAP